MKLTTRGLVIALVLIGVVVAAIFVLKDGGDPVRPADAAETGLPKIVDYGAKMCIPCKEMAVTLEELKQEYKDRVIVEIVDVYENYDLAEAAGVTMIPTQVFYDAAGKEVYRHV
ncbi:MAG: thioredoxin family protein, partial [bacterium]|nr:thioredoxin family protein [bacterium]